MLLLEFCNWLQKFYELRQQFYFFFIFYCSSSLCRITTIVTVAVIYGCKLMTELLHSVLNFWFLIFFILLLLLSYCGWQWSIFFFKFCYWKSIDILAHFHRLFSKVNSSNTNQITFKDTTLSLGSNFLSSVITKQLCNTKQNVT